MKVVYTTINGVIVHEVRNGVQRNYRPDTLGNTAALTNATTTTDTWVYWPYGEVRTRTGTTATPFQFVGTLGYYQNTGSNLAYVRARFYQATRGRWATMDPLWPDEMAYGYAIGRPAQYSDPSGLSVRLCKGTIIPGQADHWLLIIDGPYCNKTRLEYSWDGVIINGCAIDLGKPCKSPNPNPGPGDRCVTLTLPPGVEACLCKLSAELRSSPGSDTLGGRHWKRNPKNNPFGNPGAGEYNFVAHNCQDFVNAALEGCGGPKFLTDTQRCAIKCARTFLAPGIPFWLPLPF